jgi:hypothetical protein
VPAAGAWQAHAVKHWFVGKTQVVISQWILEDFNINANLQGGQN